MKSAILSVGTELLMGQTVNTNTVYLSQQLNTLGIDVMYHHTVGDNPQRLREIIDLTLKDCDLIVTTGGLGPTQDDLTKETVCEALGDELVLDEPSMEAIEDIFARQNREMTENNKKQAYLPSRALILKNAQGTAPGFALEKDDKCIICLPGPPREMKDMFEKEALPFLEKKSDGKLFFRDIRTYALGESAMETELMDLIDAQTDPTLATYAKEGECLLRIASKKKTKEEAQEAVDAMLEKVKERIGEYIYSCDGKDLPLVVGEKLIEKNISISCAESCTGGLFAKMLTDIPGISAVFDRGLVTYSNEAKMSELGVKKETLDEFGAVSEEVALEMAEGLSEVSGSDICISVTGVAGPDGGTEKKPIGLVYIGAVCNGRSECRKVKMRNINREWNRNYAMLSMMDMVNKLISG